LLFAVKDKERFAELNRALDCALAVFSVRSICSKTQGCDSRHLKTIEINETAGLVRSTTRQLVALTATVDRVRDDLERTMTVSVQHV
jgi:hypothetical protein